MFHKRLPFENYILLTGLKEAEVKARLSINTKPAKGRLDSIPEA